MTAAVLERPRATRGTSNSNQRGSSYTRRRRREWLVQTYRADVDAQVLDREAHDSAFVCIPRSCPHWLTVPACRCYRCGVLLTVDTVTVDRIVPGCKGGTYKRSNIRPACGHCNSETGGGVRS